MKNVAIFASGSGTNTENIIRYFTKSEIVNIALVVTDNPKAFVLERAKKFNIPTLTFSRSDFREEGKVLPSLRPYNIDFIVLAGFLSKVPDDMIAAYPSGIINIHPALLPKHGGKGMYGMRVHEDVVKDGDDISGITIHYIDDHYDEGTAIVQKTCRVLPSDTAEDVATKVHALEYEWYPKVIESLLTK